MTDISERFGYLWVLKVAHIYLCLFLFGAEAFVISPILANISSDIFVSQEETARAASIYVLVYALFAPLFASFGDRIDRFYSVLLGLVIFSAGNLLAGAVSNVEALILARGMSGLGGAIAGPALWATIVDKSPEPVRGRAVGFGMAAFSMGQVIGVPIGGLMASVLSWRVIFYAISVATLGAAITAYRVDAPKKLGKKRKFSISLRDLKTFDIWKSRDTTLVLCIVMLFHTANLGGYAYLGAMLLSRFGMDSSQSGLIGLAVGAGSLTGALMAGRFIDLPTFRRRSGLALTPIWCMLLAIASFITYTSTIPSLSALAIFIWFVASGAFVANSQSIIINIYPLNRSLASAWNTSTMYVGTVVGVFVFGWFIGQWNALAYASVCFAVLALLLSSYAIKKNSAAAP